MVERLIITTDLTTKVHGNIRIKTKLLGDFGNNGLLGMPYVMIRTQPLIWRII